MIHKYTCGNEVQLGDRVERVKPYNMYSMVKGQQYIVDRFSHHESDIYVVGSNNTYSINAFKLISRKGSAEMTKKINVTITPAKEVDFQIKDMKIGQFATYTYNDVTHTMMRFYDGWVALDCPRVSWGNNNPPTGICNIIEPASVIHIEV